MKLKDILGKKNVKTVVETTVKTTMEIEDVETEGAKDEKSLNKGLLRILVCLTW